MPRIKRSSIEDIRQRVSLVDVAGAYTQMKRAGSQFRGLSPFNSEKSPSFFIHPEKNVFKDYSSGNAGDLFRFIQLRENLNFHEAVETVAQRFGIQLEYEDDGMPPERMSLRKELFEIHEVATEYFHKCLQANRPEAEQMRQYWVEGRGFSMELAEDFKIGFSPPTGDGFIKYIGKKGFSIDALRESGLVYLRDHDRDLSRARARFRGRLMVPIRDVQGRVIAFTARVTDQTPKDDPSHEAKYINSPETPIFYKSHVLFGLERARTEIPEGGSLVMVEGQLDCLRCWEQGIRNAVAPQGTAITEHQMTLVRRYTSKLDCLLDGDSAGQKAALRTLPLALKAGLEVTFLVLPEGADPDDLLREGGPEALEKLRGSSLSAMDYLAGALLPNPAAATGRDKSEALERAFTIVRECESTIVREDYLSQLSRLIQVDQEAIRRDFNASSKPKSNTNQAKEGTARSKTLSNEKLTNKEAELVSLALHHEYIGEKISEIIDNEWIDTSTAPGAMLLRILAAHVEHEWLGSDNIDSLLENDEERNFIYRLLTEEPKVEDPIKAANVCLLYIFNVFWLKRSKEIETAILNEKDTDKKQRLFEERIQLRAIKRTPPTIE
ncbi:DNA primase [Rubellicoccus peritrichatus]|uniref:DNA primase n=1 Tax=Rubellicoccus peritrichatus TaxID=3080537 RepID=A0AAQ3LAE1_9BACT|nr:DNA primase [Puniceicoccus sp. CR14]WOO42215.1 DNA primase [Puniceicoccus sp. CR14]